MYATHAHRRISFGAKRAQELVKRENKRKSNATHTYIRTSFILPTQKNRSNLWKFPFVSRPTHFFFSLLVFIAFFFVVVVKLNWKKKRERTKRIFAYDFFHPLPCRVSLAWFYLFFYLFWNICTVTQFSQPVQIKEVETDTHNICFVYFSMNRNFYLWLMNNNNTSM